MMITSVFVSTDDIQFIMGKFDSKRNSLRVKSFASEPLSSGAMINGIITHDGELINCLERIKVKNKSLTKKKINLIIDSSSILIKKIKAPILSHKNMIELVENEFIEVANNYEDLLYDYSILSIDSKKKDETAEDKEGEKSSNAKTGTIICSAIERSMVQSYVDVFKKAGFKIASIDISLSPILRLGDLLDELMDKAFILSIFDGNNLVSYIFSEEGYLLTNRTRLFSDRGTREFSEEVYRSLSSIIQFNQSQQSGMTIKNIYLCGLNEDVYQVKEYVQDILNIPTGELIDDMSVRVDPKAGSFNLSSMIYATGNLMRRGGA